jgi:hypothetical protein
MKTRIFFNYASVLILLVLFGLSPARLFAGDAPTYRGKVVLIVDNTIDTDTNVSWRIDRLINDLTGDGWRVLRHDVGRGPQHPDDGIHSTNPAYGVWATNNAPRVREIRALIKADYAAAPGEVKQVFLLGHIPVPYSGDDITVNGDHYTGAQPSDLFYGNTVSPYGPGGWSDSTVNDTSAPYPEFFNWPGDGKFDQSSAPSPINLGVGRVDLFDMPEIWTNNSFATNETVSIAQYLDKDHDFRCAHFIVQRQAIMSGFNDPGCTGCSFDFCLTPDPFASIFGTNVFESCSPTPTVSNGSDLMGYFGAYGGPFDGITTIGTKTYAEVPMQVVFMNIAGSFVSDWDEQNDLLRAVLANPYIPTNGSANGYGLTATGGGKPSAQFGLGVTTLADMALGATIGEALCVGYAGNINDGLMGDPTLRMHSVQQPSNLIITNYGSTLGLNWTASSDTNVSGYNIYRAPTSRGPYTLVNTNGQISGTLSYTATRPESGSAPDNFYMVRAVETEANLVGTYTNMAVGIITNIPGYLTSYLTILSQPVDQTAAVVLDDAVTNAVAFTVDAVGSDTLGNPNIAYQWYGGTNALSDNGHYSGTKTSALLISGLQALDSGTYYVVVSNVIGTVASSNAALTIGGPPTPVADLYTNIIRNTVTNLDILSNDSDPGIASSNLTLISISSLSNPNAGIVTINSDHRTVHFVPAIGWLGDVTNTYIVSDGTSTAQTNVIICVLPVPGDTPPSVSAIGPQQMTEETTITIPFTVSDSYTAPSNLVYSFSCSNPSLIPSQNFLLIGSGSNQVLQIRGGTLQTGSGTVTMTVTDLDAQSTNISFPVTINPAVTPMLVADGLSSNGFQMSINVNQQPNSLVEILQSDDLVNWVSLGKVVLNGNLYNFIDASASLTTPQRFYTTRGDNGCGVNTVGFINVAVPANTYVNAANQLNNPLGNSMQIVITNPPGLTEIITLDPVAQSTAGYTYSRLFHRWSPNGTATLNPGQGFTIFNQSSSLTMTFIGDVPQGEQVNSDFPTVVGNVSLISSIIPASNTLISLGFPAAVGDVVYGVDSAGNQIPTATNTVSGWSPMVPTVGFGQAFWLQSGSTSNRSWTENFSPCSIQPTGIQPVLSNPQISSNAFSFNVASLAGSYWEVYDSTDLTNWTLIAGVTLDTAGAGSFTNNSIAGVPYRFYLLSDGTCCSQPIGFTRIQVGAGTTNVPGTNALIADQLDAPGGNTLDGLFNVNGAGTMPDGTSLSNESVISKWDVPSQAFVYYTWNPTAGSGWRDASGNPAGSVTLNPGEGAYLVTSNALTVTFVGLVPYGSLSLSSSTNQFRIISSILPEAGGLQTDLGYVPRGGDEVELWGGSGLNTDHYVGLQHSWSPGEPVLAVGQAFFWSSSSNTWQESLSQCEGQTVCSAPALAETQISSNTFSFSAAGPPGTIWSVYQSSDLTNWTLFEGLTLNSSGTGSCTDSNLAGVSYRFYKLSDGTCCSQPIGFTRIQVGAGTMSTAGSNSFIANQLYAAPTNTLDGLFNLHLNGSTNGTMPDGITRWKRHPEMGWRRVLELYMVQRDRVVGHKRQPRRRNNLEPRGRSSSRDEQRHDGDVCRTGWRGCIIKRRAERSVLIQLDTPAEWRTGFEFGLPSKGR